MKANKKTLMAVKRYLEEQEGYDMYDVVSDLVYETEMLKTKRTGDMLISPDECDIRWGNDEVCNLDDFINKFSGKFVEHICNVLNSFEDEDINCYSEED